MFAGWIEDCGEGWIEIANSEVKVRAGEGFVIDAGENRDHEQGGTVWKVEGKRLIFDKWSKIDWSRVDPGMGLWKTRDPELEAEVKRLWKGVRLTEKGEALEVRVSGRVGESLVLESRGKRVESEVKLTSAEKHPLTTEVLEKQLGRLGGTGFQLGKVINGVEGEVIVPLGELNRLRRRLVEELKVEGDRKVENGGRGFGAIVGWGEGRRIR